MQTCRPWKSTGMYVRACVVKTIIIVYVCRIVIVCIYLYTLHRSYLSAQDIFQVQRKNKATEAEISAACEEETGAGGDSDFDY
jgi:hypothetical protein